MCEATGSINKETAINMSRNDMRGRNNLLTYDSPSCVCDSSESILSWEVPVI